MFQDSSVTGGVASDGEIEHAEQDQSERHANVNAARLRRQNAKHLNYHYGNAASPRVVLSHFFEDESERSELVQEGRLLFYQKRGLEIFGNTPLQFTYQLKETNPRTPRQLQRRHDCPEARRRTARSIHAASRCPQPKRPMPPCISHDGVCLWQWDAGRANQPCLPMRCRF